MVWCAIGVACKQRRKTMKKILIIVLCCIIPISCWSMPKFSEGELSEYFDLCVALDKVEFTYGKKYRESPMELKLYKVTYEPFDCEELFFSLEAYSLTRNKIKYVRKRKDEIFIEFAATISGWSKAIVYMKEEDESLINRAEVFIKLGENLYYFEGKS